MDQIITPAAAALSTRYGAEMSSFGQWNETLATLFAHRSVRAYRPDALPAGTVETLVAAAQSAATSSNMQTWSVVAVTNPQTRARFAAWSGGQKQVEEAPLVLVWLADLSRAARIGARAGQAMEALPYTESAMVAMLDAALAAQNAAVAAESLGLGTCYLGSLRNKPDLVAAELGLPPQCFAVFGLTVGYIDETRPTPLRPRLPQSVVLHHERYDPAQEAEGVALYDTRFAEHQRHAGLPASGWTSRVLERLGAVRGLNGREIMREALARLGFPLR